MKGLSWCSSVLTQHSNPNELGFKFYIEFSSEKSTFIPFREYDAVDPTTEAFKA